MRGSGTEAADAEDAIIELRRFDFEVQFSWQPKLPIERHQEQQAEQENQAQP